MFYISKLTICYKLRTNFVGDGKNAIRRTFIFGSIMFCPYHEHIVVAQSHSIHWKKSQPKLYLGHVFLFRFYAICDLIFVEKHSCQRIFYETNLFSFKATDRNRQTDPHFCCLNHTHAHWPKHSRHITV